MGLVESINGTNEKAAKISERYIKTSYKYYRLKLFQQLSISVSMVFKALVIGALGLMFVLLSAIALALFVGESIKNYPLGFFIIGIIFMILLITAYFFRHVITKMVLKKLSKNFFN